MIFSRIIFLIFLSVFLLGCKKDNVVRTYYDSGALMEEYHIDEDSLITGLYKRYHPEGVLAEDCTYEKGLRNGLRKLYAVSGELESIYPYQNDKINGEYQVFYPSGKIKIKANYVNSEIVGDFFQYFENGNLKEKITFESNMENGPFEEYHESGKIKWRGTYRNGDNEFGLLEEYNEDGILIKKLMCDSMRICTTIWTIEDGDIKKQRS